MCDVSKEQNLPKEERQVDHAQDHERPEEWTPRWRHRFGHGLEAGIRQRVSYLGNGLLNAEQAEGVGRNEGGPFQLEQALVVLVGV